MTLQIQERKWNIAPYWLDGLVRELQPKSLTRNMSADVTVVGGGITALSIAWALSLAGMKVVVLEAGRIGEGSSGWPAGTITANHTLDLKKVEENLGVEQLRHLVQSMEESLARLPKLFGANDGFQSGSSLYLAGKKSHVNFLRSEHDIRLKYNLPTKFWEEKEVSSIYPGFSAAVECGGEYGVHPVRLLMALAKTVVDKGGSLYEDSPVNPTGGWEQHGKNKFIVHCRAHKVESTHLVLCTGIKTSDFGDQDELSRLLVPVVNYVLVTQPCAQVKALCDRGIINGWDSQIIYHYWRNLSDGRLLVGGADNPGSTRASAVSANEPEIRKLYSWAQNHHTFKLPPIQYAWRAGLVIPVDGLPLLKIEKRDNGGALVSAVTDGFAFALLLGNVVARAISSDQHDFDKMLSFRRHRVLEAKLLSWLPKTGLLRDMALKTGFAGFRLWDRWF
ncbi:MAG TPA: FAD-dependent oxidoreductase [Planktothrix sp.]|jgi:glycine/D-amino acid oxidase-like deaminating enzyme